MTHGVNTNDSAFLIVRLLDCVRDTGDGSACASASNENVNLAGGGLQRRRWRVDHRLNNLRTSCQLMRQGVVDL